jgi:hypothetical protein
MISLMKELIKAKYIRKNIKLLKYENKNILYTNIERYLIII